MKNITALAFILLSGFVEIFAQDSVSIKKYATLGQDDQSQNADQDGLADGELPPSLRIIPFQWVDLTEPSKEAKTFQPDAVDFFLANSADEAVDTAEMGMTMKYFGENISSVCIVINGYIALGKQTVGALIGPNSWSPSGIPSARLPNNIVAPLWVDIDFGTSQGYVFYRTFKPEKGDKSFDHMVIQWEDAGLFHDYTFGSDSSVRTTFQVVLFAEGGIMFQYKIITAQALRDGIKHDQALGYYTDLDLEKISDYMLIKNFISSISIGYEDKEGLKGISWDSDISSGMSLANELVPDWASGEGNENFLDIMDGRDRRNNAVTTSSNSGCFISKKKASAER